MKKIIIFLLVLVLLSGCKSEMHKTTSTFNVMGTTAEITIISDNAAKNKQLMYDVYDELKRVEGVFSIYDNSTPVSKLNNNGFLEADNETLCVISKSIYYSELSNGSFDITVQPILDLWSKAKYGIYPTEEEVAKTMELISYKNIKIEGRDIILTKNHMKITLGGIAKGYATDKVVELLQKNGIEHALINLGGQITAIGNKGNEPWQISLQDPKDKNNYITIITINNQSVSTSGDYERYFIENKTAHHIINPKTGTSPLELISVTIVADKAIDADALSTAVFVMGEKDGMDLVNSLSGVKALIITSNKTIIKSEGWDKVGRSG